MRSGASKCAFASITFSADCSASELGAPCVASKKRRASQRRKPLARIGQVSRWPLMSRSAKPVPSGAWNSSADCARSIRMSACVGPRPPVSPFSSAMASSSAVTRQPALFNCARSASNAARSSFFSAASRTRASGAKGAPGSVGSPLDQPFQRIADVLGRIDGGGDKVLGFVRVVVLIARPPRCGTRGPPACR